MNRFVVIVVIAAIAVGAGVYLLVEKAPSVPSTADSEELFGIPYIAFVPDNWNGKAVIFVHGLGGSKEDMLPEMSAFENLGYNTFSFDLPFHGDRRENMSVEQLPQLIRQASMEIWHISNFLKENEGASEVYLISRSLGSIVSAVALGNGADVDKAELLLPSADLRYVFTYGAVAEQQPSWLDNDSILREVDPLYALPGYRGRVHFHVGKRDSVLTPQAGVYAYNAAIQAQERRIFWHELGHSMPLDVYFMEAREFFEREESPSEGISDLLEGISIPPTAGNGIRDPGENWETCPFDWKENVLLIALQLHIEESTKVNRRIYLYDENREVFEKFANVLDNLARIFENHSAKISIQTEKNFAMADIKFGRHLLEELAERGHGVGVHSHLGHHWRNMQLTTDAERIAYNENVKRAVAMALGRTPTNIGAGFDLENVGLLGVGENGLGFTSLTSVEKPYFQATHTLSSRLHPTILPEVSMLNLATELEWLAHDPCGDIVYIPGKYWLQGAGDIHVARADTDPFIPVTQSLQMALRDVDNRFINVWYFGSHLYQCVGENDEQTEEALERYDNWLTNVVDPLVRSGRVRWMTFDEIAEIFLRWELERQKFLSMTPSSS